MPPGAGVAYVDAAGTEQQRVCRLEVELDGKRHKSFRQMYRGAKGQWLKRRAEAAQTAQAQA